MENLNFDFARQFLNQAYLWSKSFMNEADCVDTFI